MSGDGTITAVPITTTTTTHSTSNIDTHHVDPTITSNTHMVDGGRSDFHAVYANPGTQVINLATNMYNPVNHGFTAVRGGAATTNVYGMINDSSMTIGGLQDLATNMYNPVNHGFTAVRGGAAATNVYGMDNEGSMTIGGLQNLATNMYNPVNHGFTAVRGGAAATNVYGMDNEGSMTIGGLQNLIAYPAGYTGPRCQFCE